MLKSLLSRHFMQCQGWLSRQSWISLRPSQWLTIQGGPWALALTLEEPKRGNSAQLSVMRLIAVAL